MTAAVAASVEDVAPPKEDVVMEDSTTVENRYSKQSSSDSGSKKADEGEVYSPELLKAYYSRLFPYHFLYSWLNYEKSQLFPRREFSFTIEPSPGDEIYIRYQSFASEAELSAAILKRRPTKIDIGAVFLHPPKDHNSIQGKFQTQQRELVFDIDLTDYDEVRNCGCSQAKICPKCWTLMTMAVKVMDEGLRQDFGFKHIAWFYSGRRGVHAWVCDEKARTLSNEARSAVASYFEVNLGTDKNKNVMLPHPLHPMLTRCFEVLEPMFIKNILPASGHGLLATPECWNKLLDTLPEAAHHVKENMEKKWSKPTDDSTPSEKWDSLKKHLRAFVKKEDNASKAQKTLSTTERIRIELWPTEVVFRHTYPRLDINVSKMQNHLLKSPFCVHPKTGRVCVPINVDKVHEFDPFAVPSLAQLMRELDEFEKDSKEESPSRRISHDWQKTSLKESFEYFQKNFLDPMTSELMKDQRRAADEKAALTGEF